MTTKTKRGQRKLVEDTFNRLRRVLGDTRDFNTYYSQCEKAERKHRKWGRDFGGHHRKAQPVVVCAKHFAVKYVLGYISEDNPPRVEDIFDLKLECFQASALATRHSERLHAQFSLEECQAYLADVDYCDLVGPVT